MGHAAIRRTSAVCASTRNSTVGVAPGVRLWAVRVLDSMGSGTKSSQLCGINWITQYGPSLGIKVVNSSQLMLNSTSDDGNCGNTNGDVMHQAICASTQAGITWVFAAMNSTTDFKNVGGATYDEVLTVTAMADNVARLFKADTAIAVTGVGGPDPDDGIAPGTVWIATHVAGTTDAHLHDLHGDPTAIIEQTCTLALDFLTVALG